MSQVDHPKNVYLWLKVPVSFLSAQQLYNKETEDSVWNNLMIRHFRSNKEWESEIIQESNCISRKRLSFTLRGQYQRESNIHLKELKNRFASYKSYKIKLFSCKHFLISVSKRYEGSMVKKYGKNNIGMICIFPVRKVIL